jgi:formylglycine-generating enzyme required for sulfatase activity
MAKQYSSLADFQKDYQYDLSDEKSFLGEGTYGQVIKAYDDTNHRFVALKIGKDLMTEFEVAKNLEHRNIAKYEACHRIPDKNTGVKDYAIMQLYPEGNLSQLLKNKTLSIEQKKEIARGILEGLKYLHSQGRIHRDLKPANILIVKKQNEYIPLISDFGLTKVVKENDYVDGSDVELSDGRGTASYKAPEQIEGDKAHFNLDLWAFGVILYEMLLGERPFTTGKTGNESQRFNELLRQIKEVAIPEKISTIQQPYQAIVRNCLVKDIHKRVRRADELIEMLGESKEKEQETDEAKDKLGTDKEDIQAEVNETDESPKIPPSPLPVKKYLTIALIFIVCVALTSLSYLEIKKKATIEKLVSQMVFVESGTFDMGNSDGKADEKPVHSVKVENFHMGKYEVTQAQWQAVMWNNPSFFEGCDDCPVENISWNDTQTFLKKLNKITGKNYRLPTEEEWEYAARGGKQWRVRYHYSGSNDLNSVGWCLENSWHNDSWHDSGRSTHPVGTKSPNQLQIYDMTGNVRELCQDLYKGYCDSTDKTDYIKSDRVVRGGSCIDPSDQVQVTVRDKSRSDYPYFVIGFRIVSPIRRRPRAITL